jgi:hypothetical protein
MTTITYGYLELEYLVYPYGAAVVGESFNAQTNQQIISSNAVRSQTSQLITGFLRNFGAQTDQEIVSSTTVRAQTTQQITNVTPIRSQFEARRLDDFPILSEVDRILTGASKLTRSEFSRGPVSHQICGGYLVDDYLMMPYLVTQICAHMRTQTELNLVKNTPILSQVDREITETQSFKAQAIMTIYDTYDLKAQFNRVASFRINSQILFALYNTTNLRILYQFPSRGTSGTNWNVVSGGTAAGDFSVNNVNTDIVEQVYRSTATTCVLQSDTQVTQGIFLDTLAILNHNLTTSATVLLQGSNDVSFGSIPFTETLSVEKTNLYYIAPYLPLTSYRYWRIDVTDTTNPDGYIQMGTIVFGSTIIFNGECFTDEVVRRKIHFADRVRTEAFSNVSNDRALKYSVSLNFRKLNYGRANYENLIEVVDYVRTSLKALWIPTPEFASRFAVFGKLQEMPVENHKVIGEDADYIDLDITVDESL